MKTFSQFLQELEEAKSYKKVYAAKVAAARQRQSDDIENRKKRFAHSQMTLKIVKKDLLSKENLNNTEKKKKQNKNVKRKSIKSMLSMLTS
jgi:hypothetical protein